MAKSAGISQNLRGYDSWIDISSQPSSPLQSPVNNEIVTTGLRIQNPKNTRRRRKCVSRFSPVPDETRYTSSQEEYEESESDEDHILAGSDEQTVYNSFSALSPYETDSDSDRGKRVKTLPVGGTETRALLDPQHDLFSQQSPNKCHISPESYLSPRSTHGQYPHVARNVFQQQIYRRPTDHDAALRASLTTLLSIGAAAARGLPKRELSSGRDNLSGRSQENNESIGLRFMSESELLSSSSRQPSVPSVKPTNVISSYNTLIEKKNPKRSSNENTKEIKSQSVSVSQENTNSPTFLTWAVSAGVLVIMSVFGFGAGYLIGRDAGRQEIMAGLNGSVLSNDSVCSREVIGSSSTGFKNFKWSFGTGSQGIIT